MWFALWLAFAHAQTIQSDCAPAELKIVPTLGKFTAWDCTPVKVDPEKEQILIAAVVNGPTGLESSIFLYDRKGFSGQATPAFKSPTIGYDAFPVLLNQVYRLIFVHPSSDRSRLVFYANFQTGPAATHFARWEFSYENKEIKEGGNRTWALDAGVLPKIYEERGTFRALLGSRSVEM
jgi:hypothetical protein